MDAAISAHGAERRLKPVFSIDVRMGYIFKGVGLREWGCGHDTISKPGQGRVVSTLDLSCN
jgi:hypothetical protein